MKTANEKLAEDMKVSRVSVCGALWKEVSGVAFGSVTSLCVWCV